MSVEYSATRALAASHISIEAPLPTRTFEVLRRCGLTVEPGAMVFTSPNDFERRFPGTGGGIYETELDGSRVRGVHESLSLQRFANPIVRLMLPFRMPRVAGSVLAPRPAHRAIP